MTTCPVPTPAERLYGDIHGRAVAALTAKVHAALDEAVAQARAEIEAAGLDLPPPPRDYLASILEQRLFCLLCKADPESFAGGDPKVAMAIIANKQAIARHHWGAPIPPTR